MSDKNKVVWSEGMFLRPQHMQQQERYFETCAQRGVAASLGYCWGFSELEIDPQSLATGTVLVRRASGLLPDGTPFDLAEDDVPALAFDFPADVRDDKVCLVLPPLREGEESVIYDEDVMSSARYKAVTRQAIDANKFGAGAAEIQVGQPRFRLVLEKLVPAGWVSMGLVSVVERQTNKALLLDPTYIPPTLACNKQDVLAGFIHEVSSLLDQRGNALAERIEGGGRSGISDIGEFLMMMLINRWYPRLNHLKKVEMLHPERLYSDLIALAGELATFLPSKRRTSEYSGYVHDDLHTTFSEVMKDLRNRLTLVLKQTILRIELQNRRYGVKAAVVPDSALFREASFVLAVHSSMPAEQILARIPAQTKIGPVEKIRDLINLHLPGVVLRPLPAAPRELPYHAGYSYFEIDTQHELWKELEKSAGVALHVAGEFPDLELECWAIRTEE